MVEVSICIVNWNTRELLRKCLKSIEEKTSGIIYEIIVVDNASMDGSAEMVKNEFPSVKLLESSENVGFAKGNNLAYRESEGEYILYLNPDTELQTNAICGMTRVLIRNKHIGGVGCKLVSPDGKIQYTCACTFPTVINQVCFLLFLNRIFRKYKAFSSSELEYWDHQNSSTVDCLSGACMMVRKEVIDELGGFDDHVFMYAEDLDLCYRILTAGWKIYYLSTDIIVHNQGASSNKKGEMFAVIKQQESIEYFLTKHFGAKTAFAHRLVMTFGSPYRVLCGILLIPLFKVYGRRFDINPIQMTRKYATLFLWAIGQRRS